jgi:hypothetical protein
VLQEGRRERSIAAVRTWNTDSRHSSQHTWQSSHLSGAAGKKRESSSRNRNSNLAVRTWDTNSRHTQHGTLNLLERKQQQQSSKKEASGVIQQLTGWPPNARSDTTPE